MPFATRAFLCSFVPFSVLLLSSFWAIQALVMRAVHGSVHESLRENQKLITRLQARTELENSRSLHVLAENPALKAGIELLLLNPASREARLTVEDQLREICAGLHYDFLLVRAAGGRAMAGVIRNGPSLDALDL